MPTRIVARSTLALVLWVWSCCALALETDQFYAWGRPLDDATEVLNAKVNNEIAAALGHVNGRSSWNHRTCHRVARRILTHFRMFIFHDLELWASNTSLVDRIPASPEEELEYRKRYLYHRTGILDPGTWLPPSPTIELNGVRIGTDKLAHFFSEGWWYYKWYRKARNSGLSHEEAERRAIRRGLLIERTVLGQTSSGVLSLADLEANYQGMLFFDRLCDAEDPWLEKSPSGWRLVRPFDFRNYVTPEWDESYQPSIFNKRRWRKVLPILQGYCHMLDDPEVQQQRREYEKRDKITPTEERMRVLIDKGKFPDPTQFSIEQNCPG